MLGTRKQLYVGKQSQVNLKKTTFDFFSSIFFSDPPPFSFRAWDRQWRSYTKQL